MAAISVSDVVEIAKLAKDIYDKYEGAQDDRKALVELCESIHIILKSIKEPEKFNEIKEKKGTDALEFILKRLRATLQELDEFLEANQLTSGLKGLFKTTKYALFTNGLRDRLKQELDVHIQLLQTALSSKGRQADLVIQEQLASLVEAQGARDEVMNQMFDAIVRVHELVENKDRDIENQSGLTKLWDTKTRPATDLESLGPAIKVYSNMTGIDKTKIERTATIAIARRAGTLRPRSKHNGPTPQPDTDAPGPSASPSDKRPDKLLSHTRPTPTPRVPSPHSAPGASGGNVRIDAESELREPHPGPKTLNREERERWEEWERREKRQRYEDQQRREEWDRLEQHQQRKERERREEWNRREQQKQREEQERRVEWDRCEERQRQRHGDLQRREEQHRRDHEHLREDQQRQRLEEQQLREERRRQQHEAQQWSRELQRREQLLRGEEQQLLEEPQHREVRLRRVEYEQDELTLQDDRSSEQDIDALHNAIHAQAVAQARQRAAALQFTREDWNWRNQLPAIEGPRRASRNSRPSSLNGIRPQSVRARPYSGIG